MVRGRVNIRSKVSADSFRLIGCRDQTIDSCQPKLCQSATEGMTKMSYKYGTNAKHSLRSRSGQMKSPYENIARMSCDTCLTGHLGRRIRWWHSFSHLAQCLVKKCQKGQILKLIKTCTYLAQFCLRIPKISFALMCDKQKFEKLRFINLTSSPLPGFRQLHSHK